MLKKKYTNIRRYVVEIKCQLDATDEFLLQILLLAQHVSDTIMPIIRSSRVLYKCPFCGLLQHSANRTHTTLSSTLYRQLESQTPNTTGRSHLYNVMNTQRDGILILK
jgi:hypothetical protein